MKNISQLLWFTNLLAKLVASKRRNASNLFSFLFQWGIMIELWSPLVGQTTSARQTKYQKVFFFFSFSWFRHFLYDRRNENKLGLFRIRWLSYSCTSYDENILSFLFISFLLMHTLGKKRILLKTKFC